MWPQVGNRVDSTLLVHSFSRFTSLFVSIRTVVSWFGTIEGTYRERNDETTGKDALFTSLVLFLRNGASV